ncbi:MAG: NAD(P)H-quinone oxidoreductase [Actinomycetia bacterium]|nr:NAD(P)H-quinone oxidoreductase [Actinomycetes bacterium]
MRAVVVENPGGPESMTIAEVEAPQPAAGEVRIRTQAAGINRADILQRQGHYNPPAGSSPYLGLEVSGTIDALGEGVTGWSEGDEVCALLVGGGYADQVCVPADQLLPVPTGVSLIEAAALPEVVCTVWSNLFMTADLQDGDTLLVHGGSSGIGTMAIQLAREQVAATVAVTAGTAEKLEFCRDLGAEILINYRDEDFVEQVREATGGTGADVILDNMGAKYLQRNIDTLADGGRLVIIGMQGGVKAEFNIATLLGKRGAVIATALRSRSAQQKAEIVAQVREHVWPLIEAGRVRPIIHGTYPLDDVAQAHAEMESSRHIGKILLTL